MSAFAQDKTQAFKDAMEARENKNWAKVITELRRAIQANPQESSAMVEWGGGFLRGRKKSEPYLPYFFLGEALYKQQQSDCIGAIEAWANSERQSALKTFGDYARVVTDGYTVCESKGILPPSKYDALNARTAQHYSEVNNLAATVSALGQANPDLWRPDVRSDDEKALTELKNARERLLSAAKTRSKNDFDTAYAAAERARVILAGIESNLKGALDTLQNVASISREVDNVLNAAEALDRQIEAKKTALNPSLAAVRQQGREAIGRARERQGAGVKSSNLAALNDARSLGQDASAKFKQVIDDLGRLERGSLEKQLSDAIAAAQQATFMLDGLFGTLEKRLAANPALVVSEVVAEQTAIRKQAETAKKRIDTATKTENVAALVQATTLTVETRDRLSALIAKFGPLSLRERGVNEALEEGARQYLSGNYQGAIAALNPEGSFPAEAPLQLHVHLFRAASLYALYARSGESDQSLRTKALAEVEECKKIDSAFQPDARIFSPRFIGFFRAGSAGT